MLARTSILYKGGGHLQTQRDISDKDPLFDASRLRYIGLVDEKVVVQIALATMSHSTTDYISIQRLIP